MEKFKGTPAPWHVVNFGGWLHIQDEPFYEGKDILNEEECPVAIHNATLAAAAPELLEALQLMVDVFHNQTMEQQDAKVKALQAITKALTNS